VAAARQHDQAAQLRHEPRQIGYVPIHARKLDDRIAVARDIERGNRHTHRAVEKIAATPLRRIGKPIEVAYGVLFLASDEASFITGTELVIDGGFIAQ
jgi:NAD(P)-dependent dehydrogenase (short-subunit alcohol dehydrogenase family)